MLISCNWGDLEVYPYDLKLNDIRNFILVSIKISSPEEA